MEHQGAEVRCRMTRAGDDTVGYRPLAGRAALMTEALRRVWAKDLDARALYELPAEGGGVRCRTGLPIPGARRA